MAPSEYRSSIKELIKFAEGVLRLKKVLDDADAIEAKTADHAKRHETAVAAYTKEMTEYLDKVQQAQDLYEQSKADLAKHRADYETVKAQLAKATDDLKAKHDQTVAAAKAQADATIHSLNTEKASVMKSLQDAKTLHKAELAAMGAEKARLDSELTKLREVRQKMLEQLQTGV
jgi:chromosome segregation ATPase